VAWLSAGGYRPLVVGSLARIQADRPYDRPVQLRRGLLLFALVLSAVSLGAALSAPRDEGGEPATPAPAPRSDTPAVTAIELRQPAPETPPVRQVRTGAHVVLRVSAREPGNVEIPGLGLLQPVSPGTPAVFDLLATRPGRYDVELVTLGAERIRLGALVVAR
jgi:hypothetical protein